MTRFFWIEVKVPDVLAGAFLSAVTGHDDDIILAAEKAMRARLDEIAFAPVDAGHLELDELEEGGAPAPSWPEFTAARQIEAHLLDAHRVDVGSLARDARSFEAVRQWHAELHRDQRWAFPHAHAKPDLVVAEPPTRPVFGVYRIHPAVLLHAGLDGPLPPAGWYWQHEGLDPGSKSLLLGPYATPLDAATDERALKWVELAGVTSVLGWVDDRGRGTMLPETAL